MFIRRAHTPRNHPLLSPSLRFLSTNTKSFSNKPKQTTSTATMPSYIVTCKDDASPEQIEAAKQHAKDQGGEITHEYTLIKGFAVKFPEDSVQTLANHEHVKDVEADQEVRTQ
ncbi:hypothetical protein QBC41DRAFT_156535 [Cercophora samala]|uniref:Inhibitor I9 domain-containing protein n=1 Tax=Cercophora samala TaxID=330535 RepID=A0AA39Z9N2_9PEZI|nr:hypothetical protein QBC41DRAFT_156535 [Cercophora samala]